MRKFVLAILQSLLCTITVLAQVGANDNTFSSTNRAAANSSVSAIALQADGRAIIGGSFTTYDNVSRNRIARINSDGSLDNSFNPGSGANGGEVVALAVQPDGKIISAGGFTTYNGSARNRIARINSNGVIDASFNLGAGANSTVWAIALQANGKIIIAGSFTTFNGVTCNRITRLNNDGTIDSTFTTGTGANSEIRTIALQPDGKLIVAGDFTNYNGTAINRIARLYSNGTLDTSFIVGSGVSTSVYTTAIQPDGKIILGGDFSSYNGNARNRIARINSDGSFDASFNPSGGANNTVRSIAIQSNGKIFVGGSFGLFNGTGKNHIVRLNSDGTLDNTYTGTGTDGFAVFVINVQSNDKVNIGGDFTSYNGAIKNRLVRLSADGSTDASFNYSPGANATVLMMTLQPNGKIIIGGSFTTVNDTVQTRLSRLTGDGHIDASFSSGIPSNQIVTASITQPDGKIIIGGTFTSYSGISRSRIARLNSDGTLDSTFNPGTGANNLVRALALQPDGKIIIGGSFTSFNGTTRISMARINSNGSLDPSFVPATFQEDAGSSIFSIVIQPDGKIIYGSNALSRKMARFNSDGSLDATFVSNNGANNTVSAIALQPDGKIIIGGLFTTYGGVSRNRIARINVDGTLDVSFSPGTGANGDVNAVVLSGDGKLLIGGAFTTYNGSTRNRIAQLNSDGTVASTFTQGANSTINVLALQSDGKLLMAGDFTTYAGVGRMRVARAICSAITGSSISSGEYQFCSGDTVPIDYTVSGFFPQGNVFAAQLSGGSLVSPLNIGSVASTSSGTIKAVIPPNLPGGYANFYGLRVFCSDPAIAGSLSGVLLIKASASSNAPLCAGDTLQLSSDAVPDSITNISTFSWTGPNGFTSTEQNPTINNITAADTGIYTVTATHNGCSASVHVSLATSPDGSVSSNSPVCEGLTLQLTAAGGNFYSWTGPNGFTASGSSVSRVNIAAVDSGTYTVMITANSCAPSLKSTHVSVTPKPFVTFSGLAPEYCRSGTANVLTGLPTGGHFSGGGIISNTFTPAFAGSYTIKYFSPSYLGCPIDSAVHTTVVHELPTVTINASAGNVLCPGVPKNLTAITSGSSFLWSTGATANSIAVDGAANYKVSVTDDNGCSSTASKIISNDVAPKLTSNTSGVICQGDAVILRFKNATSILWSTGETTDSISASPSSSTRYVVQGNSTNGCFYKDSMLITVTPLVPPGPVNNMLPSDNALDLSLPLTLTWFPGAFNTKYDIYIWLDSLPQPTTPFASNYSGINLTVSSGLVFGARYKWRVVSKNGNCFSTNGPVQHFTLRQLPDLAVQNIQFPASAFAGQSVSISWEVINNGKGSTGTGSWNDAIFLSADTILDFEDAVFGGGNHVGGDIYVGGFSNFSALHSGQSYANSKNYTLPITTAGTYYVIIIANAFQQLKEADSSITQNWILPSNNIRRSAAPLTVLVPPLPDLRVISVVNQNNAFSGDTINVTYTVKNFGSGSSSLKTWQDAVYITDQPILNTTMPSVKPITKDDCGMPLPDAHLLSTGFITGNLLPDSSYTRTIKIPLPKNIFGTAFIFINTDSSNAVYEGAFENNNYFSNPIQIFLTPPSDLVAKEIVNPTAASAGEQITVSWTVKNEGFAPSNKLVNGKRTLPWKDVLFMTTNPSYNLSNAFTAQEQDFYHDGYVTAIDPEDLVPHTGGAYVPHGRRRYDLCDLQSNIASLQAHINLVGCSIYDGDGPLVNSYYCFPCDGPCASDIFKKAYYKRLLRELMDQTLDPGESYTISSKVTVPENYSGIYYFYLKTDASNQIFEYTNENNNILRSDPVTISKPDLSVANVTASASTAESGTTVTMQWQVVNSGNGGVFNRARRDKIFLSASSTFNPATAIAIDSTIFSESVPAGATLNKQKTVTLPFNVLGNYHLFIYSDSDNEISETDENNNVNIIGPAIQINLTTWADLVVSTLNLPSNSLETSQPVSITYSVTNAGTLPGEGNWTDSLFISAKTTWNRDSSVFIGRYVQSRFLAIGDSYSEASTIALPLTQSIPNAKDSSLCFFYLVTDATKSVFENTGEGNNIHRSAPVLLFDKYVDHIVTQTSGSDTTAAGASYSVQWTVMNTGKLLSTSYYKTWEDNFYLSTDTTLDASDLLFGSKLVSNPLVTGTTYTLKQSFKIPNGISGDYYLIASTALVSKIAGEKNRTNNTNVYRDAAGAPKTIHIKATPPSDLKVIALEVPSQAISGQPIVVKFTVKNEGTVFTSVKHWDDVIFLSTSFNVGGNILKGKQFSGGLAPGDTYSDSIQLFLPVQASGNYVIIAKTDNRDAVYETDKSNNLGYALITITQPPPCDLLVAQITVPDSAETGAPVTVSWELANTSINPANGFSKEAVYFSKDSVWDVGDPLLGIAINTINVAPFSSVTHSLTADLTGTATGYHYVIVKADLLDNIFESNENNNVTASSGQVAVTVKNLPLNVVTPDLLVNNKFLFYRFDASDSLAGETLLITLKGDSINGVNEIYASINEIPSRSAFDFTFSNPVSGNQELVIPALVKGTYYFTIYGRTVSPAQDITLLAKILPFEIRAVNTAKGGNTGNVTVKITGSKFTPSMQAHLLSNTSALDIPATRVTYVNSTTVFATFNLTQKPLGTYDVTLVKPDSNVAVLDNGFEIETGNTGTFYVNGVSNSGMTGSPDAPGCDPGAAAGINQSLQFSVNAPTYVNLGRIIPMQITFGNAGNVDIPVPSRMLVCNQKFPLAFDLPGLQLNKEELYIEFEEPGGVPGILRAGATATITVFSKAVSVGAHTKAIFTLK